MIRVPLALLLIASLSPTAQTVIKGHHLGESASEFLDADKAVRDQIHQCHVDAPQPLSPEQIKALSDADVVQLSLGFTDFPNRKKLMQRAAAGNVLSPDHRYSGQKVFCEAAIKVLEQGGSGIFLSDVYFENSARPLLQYGFWKGGLAEIVIDTMQGSYDDAVTDFSERARVNPMQEQIPMQNAMGATWKDRRALWESPELYAVLNESRNPANRNMSLVVQSRAYHEANVALQKAAHKSALD